MFLLDYKDRKYLMYDTDDCSLETTTLSKVAKYVQRTGREIHRDEYGITYEHPNFPINFTVYIDEHTPWDVNAVGYVWFFKDCKLVRVFDKIFCVNQVGHREKKVEISMAYLDYADRDCVCLNGTQVVALVIDGYRYPIRKTGHGIIVPDCPYLTYNEESIFRACKMNKYLITNWCLLANASPSLKRRLMVEL